MHRILLLLLALVGVFPSTASASGKPFDVWLAELRAEAKRRGIKEQTLRALDGLSPIPRVLELDRHQPESRMTLEEFLSQMVNAEQIDNGRRSLRQHHQLLWEIANRYGVHPEFIIALWGVETRFGLITGDFSLVGALATLAHDGRRASLFRTQLLDALRILEEGHIRPEAMKGSWAGAMGHCQFMPSTFLAYAVDQDGDGRRDIWESLPDVFASTANFLSRIGWKRAAPWGRAVKLPDGFDSRLAGLEVKKKLSDWNALGIRELDGAPLRGSELEASLVRPGGHGGPSYLVHHNYRVLLRWNRSQYFATAVSLLADSLATPH
jgi:membrane-bound lytic murein transglycosylase B